MEHTLLKVFNVAWTGSPAQELAFLKMRRHRKFFALLTSRVVFNLLCVRHPNRRVLIFNCTNGRSGSSFLDIVVTQALALSVKHGHKEHRDGAFDHVIFCSNVTYADGNFKGGVLTLSVPPLVSTNMIF
jgi:hypothetical protein